MGMQVEKVKALLTEKLAPTFLEIEDESHRHANHHFAGHDGGSHFIALIVSPQFEGMSLVDRHKAVYAVLGDYIASGDIHALGLKTYTEAEWRKKAE